MVHIYVCLVLFDSLRSPGLCPARLLCPWDYPNKNPGVGCHFLLQRISPGIELGAPALVGKFFTTEPLGKPRRSTTFVKLSKGYLQSKNNSCKVYWQKTVLFCLTSCSTSGLIAMINVLARARPSGQF